MPNVCHKTTKSNQALGPTGLFLRVGGHPELAFRSSCHGQALKPPAVTAVNSRPQPFA